MRTFKETEMEYKDQIIQCIVDSCGDYYFRPQEIVKIIHNDQFLVRTWCNLFCKAVPNEELRVSYRNVDYYHEEVVQYVCYHDHTKQGIKAWYDFNKILASYWLKRELEEEKEE